MKTNRFFLTDWFSLCVLAAGVCPARDWPVWRGPLGIGASDEKNLPLQWRPTENACWRVALPEPGNSTPIVWKSRVFLTQAGDEDRTLCFELATGNLVWEERLHGSGKSGQNWSSIMLAGGNCYTITQSGDCFVFKAGPKFELVAVNSLGERSNSSIVASNGELFICTYAALWCIGAKE